MGYSDETWYVGKSTTHVVCCHQMHIFNTSFAYLLWLANNKKKKSNLISRALLDISPKAAHTVYSVNIASA